MTDRVELRGLRVLGRHGLLPEERQREQPFEVDLDLEMDLGAAGASDDLSDTVDYGAVAEAVRRVVGASHSELLEHLALRIARASIEAAGGAADRVDAVTVAIRKLRPPVAVDMASAGVRIRRERRDLVPQG